MFIECFIIKRFPIFSEAGPLTFLKTTKKIFETVCRVADEFADFCPDQSIHFCVK